MNNNKKDDPVVFVRCMTYNQEQYIEDALNGFVMQKTNFKYVVAVVDDASTDSNVSVILDYVARNCDCTTNYTDEEKDYGRVIQAYPLTNPNCLLYVVLLKENHFRKKPKRPYYVQIEGKAKYIAMCEGDDYWIDRYKLQKQVDFLDAHPDYTFVFHNAIMHYQDSIQPDRMMKTFQTGTYSTAQLVELWQLPLASFIYRRYVEDSEIHQNLAKVCTGGFARLLAASKLGKVYGIAECMSVYRKNSNGVSSSMSPARCLQMDYDLAIATEDVETANVMHKRALDSLLRYLPRRIKGDEAAKDLWVTAKKYDKWLPYEATVLFILKSPKIIIRTMKKKIF